MDWTEGKGVFWIGLSEKRQEGKYLWESGRPLTAEIAAHWFPGEPNNNYDGNEDCTVVSGKALHDVLCSLKFAFVCQKLDGEFDSEIYSTVKNTESFHETSNPQRI